MEQIAVIASLREGMHERAKALLADGAPFDPATEGFTRHAVYLSSHEVVFVFEAHEVEWIVDDVVSEPFRWSVAEAFDAWRPLVDGEPRIGRVVYSWERESAQARSGAASRK
jgi:hypothetical protein